jgi:predicted GTPase
MDQLRNLADIFISNGRETSENIKNVLEREINTPVNIAFIGETKSGKSTIINSLRELYPTDPGFAAVDVEVCTSEPCAYTNETFPNIVFWDIPGLNIPGYTIQNYLEKIKDVKIENNGKYKIQF